MSWLAFIFALPFIFVVVFLCWVFLRKTPYQRAQILFRKIHEYADSSGQPAALARVRISLPMLVEAVKDMDVAYLKIFLNRLKKDYPR